MYQERFSKLNRKRYSISLIKQKKIDAKALAQKKEFESQLNELSENRIKAVLQNYKLTDSGVISYKSYEGYSRNVKKSSLINLLNYNPEIENYWKDGKPFDPALGYGVKDLKDYRTLSPKQVRDCRKLCNKLSYYTANRKFKSKKTGTYNFRIGFISLTTPLNTTDQQSLKAFEGFLDYLRRTANCIYVWKKELGEEGNRLHYHIMVNNFIPYYIVSWKWKRLLLEQGVKWPKNKKGEDTTSHYRIELPRNKKQTSSYISKYIVKGCELPKGHGYIIGCSEILKELKETVLIESEIENTELWNLIKSNKTIYTDYVGIICCDLLKVKKIAPMLYNIFLKQYYSFRDTLTLPQRFQTV